jgi:hypothetical protein
MSRFPHAWLRRAIWLMLAISAGWVIYKFGSAYAQCRAIGSAKGTCILSALFDAYQDVWVLVTSTVYKILSFLLP